MLKYERNGWREIVLLTKLNDGWLMTYIWINTCA